MESFEIREFRPLRLTLEGIGPFQSRVEVIDFTNDNNEPCNLFLLLSQNGRGKTTVLEVMTKLIDMLKIAPDQYLNMYMHAKEVLADDPPSFWDNTVGARLDVLVRYVVNDANFTSVLSLQRAPGPLLVSEWTGQDLARVGASDWYLFEPFAHQPLVARASHFNKNNWFGRMYQQIIEGCKKNGEDAGSTLHTLPTLLYFSAYRNVVPIAADQQRTISAPRNWHYRPAQTFGAAGADWRDSLDNLLVWLKWLDNGRFEEVVKLVNEHVFAGTDTCIKGIRRDPPEAEVMRAGNLHRLDALSSGEKSLVQLFMRIGAHRTRNTILLIDEPEVHLHENWKYRLFYQLKKLAQASFPGLTIIVATHSQEMMKALALEVEEPKLVKGGYLFETAQEEAQAEKIRQEALLAYGDI